MTNKSSTNNPAGRARPAVWLAAATTLLLAAPVSGASQDEARNYLELRSDPDGRCQILSQGGKLRVLSNRHPGRAIKYRLIRVFGPAKPQGYVVGIAPSDGSVVKLGCTLVDGRAQDWRLERAQFIDEE
jgi:hypothetical protein